MSWMLLVMEGRDDRTAPVEEARRRYERMMAYAGELAGEGKLVAAEALALPEKASARLKKRGGSRSLVDGPFAETKEIVGGFFLLNVANREEALAVAERCPAAEWSTVEVRRVAACFEETT